MYLWKFDDGLETKGRRGQRRLTLDHVVSVAPVCWWRRVHAPSVTNHCIDLKTRSLRLQPVLHGGASISVSPVSPGHVDGRLRPLWLITPLIGWRTGSFFSTSVRVKHFQLNWYWPDLWALLRRIINFMHMTSVNITMATDWRSSRRHQWLHVQEDTVSGDKEELWTGETRKTDTDERRK